MTTLMIGCVLCSTKSAGRLATRTAALRCATRCFGDIGGEWPSAIHRSSCCAVFLLPLATILSVASGSGRILTSNPMKTAIIGNRLKVGPQAAKQPNDLDVAATLSLQPSARSDPVEVAVNVELQQVARRVARTPRRFRLDAPETRCREVEPVDKHVDETAPNCRPRRNRQPPPATTEAGLVRIRRCEPCAILTSQTPRRNPLRPITVCFTSAPPRHLSRGYSTMENGARAAEATELLITRHSALSCKT